MEKVLVVGGAGYIGSHTAKALKLKIVKKQPKNKLFVNLSIIMFITFSKIK